MTSEDRMRKYIIALVKRLPDDSLELVLARLMRVAEGLDRMYAPALPQKLPEYLKNDKRR